MKKFKYIRYAFETMIVVILFATLFWGYNTESDDAKLLIQFIMVTATFLLATDDLVLGAIYKKDREENIEYSDKKKWLLTFSLLGLLLGIMLIFILPVFGVNNVKPVQ